MGMGEMSVFGEDEEEDEEEEDKRTDSPLCS
jgi:hypothetical protein